jgi:hypothetical protein
VKYSSVGEFISQLIILIAICSAITGVFALIFAIRKKTRQIDCYSAILLRQRFVVFVSATLLWGLFSIRIAMVVWGCLFLAFRCCFFNKDARRLEELYRQYEDSQNYPLVCSIKDCKATFFEPEQKSSAEPQFRYPFSEYMLSMPVLCLVILLGMSTISQNSIIVYSVEFLVVATAWYVLLGKFVYHISLNSPGSLFYLSPGLAYIPVVVVGIVYYFVCIVIISTTSACINI